MRHFSGEFVGMRPLMADELDLIAGGEGEDTDDVSEETTDDKACEIASLIRSQPNYANQEFGYFILSDGSGIRMSQQFSGSSGDIQFGPNDTLSLSMLGVDSWNQVVGFVHNHPYETDNPLVPGDINVINRRPSAADWNIADQISALQSGNPVEFRNYIIGPDNVSRQYDTSDSRNSTSTDTSGGNCPSS